MSNEYAIDPDVESYMDVGYGSGDYLAQQDIDAIMNLGGTPEQIAANKSTVSDLLSTFGSSVLKMFQKPNGETDWGKVVTAGGGLLGLAQALRGGGRNQPVGYQGGIPKYEAVRTAVAQSYDPNRRPGSGGQRYFTDVRYTPSSDAAAITAAREAAAEEAKGLRALNEARASEREVKASQTLAHGGIAALAKGRYLNGASDGMADKIPATIEGREPAKLSHGEFVIPADVVSHLGNGNSEAGAQRLYDMMDRIRKARTGTPKQGKQINPNKFIPS